MPLMSTEKYRFKSIILESLSAQNNSNTSHLTATVRLKKKNPSVAREREVKKKVLASRIGPDTYSTELKAGSLSRGFE